MIPRLKIIFSLLFIVLLLVKDIKTSIIHHDIHPVVTDSSEEHLKDSAHDEGAESVKIGKQKGEKIHEIDTTINDSHKNQVSKASDEATYLKKDHDIKSTKEGDAFEGYNSEKDKEEDTAASGFKRGHKKGHHKQGFQNSYHKDESGNKSSYFDDFTDEGDQAKYNSKINRHDNEGGRSYHGSNDNGQEFVRDNIHQGGYNRYGDNGMKNAVHQDHARKYYLDDAENYDKFHDGRNRYDRGKSYARRQHNEPVPHFPAPPVPDHRDWGWQRWDGRRDNPRPDWNRDRGFDRDSSWTNDAPIYYDDPGYGNGYGYSETQADPVTQIPKNAPVVAQRKQTITIYEDPRYDGSDKGQLRREEGDSLQLEFKPSAQRYASYDDEYTVRQPQVNSREMEASEINRLVYNYRRQ